MTIRIARKHRAAKLLLGARRNTSHPAELNPRTRYDERLSKTPTKSRLLCYIFKQIPSINQALWPIVKRQSENAISEALQTQQRF